MDAIVFWTKNAKPFLPHIGILEDAGLNYYFQYTLTSYPKDVETRVPSYEILRDEFIRLASKVGHKKVVWRYDPIIISKKLTFEWHLEVFERIAAELQGSTDRAVISVVDYYQKTLRNLATHSFLPDYSQHPENEELFAGFIKSLAAIAQKNLMEIQSCAEAIPLTTYGVPPGKCVDDKLIKELFELEVTHNKDHGQRAECGCVKSVDIGVYDTCLHGCQYCYATKNHALAKMNYNRHDFMSPSLTGWFDATPPEIPSFSQLSLNM